jgi:hypothetical protein
MDQKKGKKPVKEERKTKTSSNNNSGTTQQDNYWICCSDGGHVFMKGGDLEKLLDAMPTLRFLLFGHPNMQPKPLEKNANDGSILLEIDPALEVSKSSFILLVNCLFNTTALPPRTAEGSRLLELEETVRTLGGCDDLEKRLKDCSTNPLTPKQDTTAAFDWTILESHMPIDENSVRELRKEGFSYCSWEKQRIGTRHYFRKSKEQQRR